MDAMPGIIPLGVPSKSTAFSCVRPRPPGRGRRSRNNPGCALIGLPCKAREFPIPIGFVFWYHLPCSRGIPPRTRIPRDSAREEMKK